MASYPWVAEARTAMAEPLGEVFAKSPAVSDWMSRVGERAAVKTGMRVLEE